jgi:hypothetical protein
MQDSSGLDDGNDDHGADSPDVDVNDDGDTDEADEVTPKPIERSDKGDLISFKEKSIFY